MQNTSDSFDGAKQSPDAQSSDKLQAPQTPEERFDRLQYSCDQLSSELEIVKGNLRSRKQETTNLKILLYTGLALLLVGFMIFNTSMQRLQIENLESSLTELRSQMRQDLVGEVTRMENILIASNVMSRDKLNVQEAMLRDALENLRYAATKIKSTAPESDTALEQLRGNSEALLAAFTEYKEEKSAWLEKKGFSSAHVNPASAPENAPPEPGQP